MVALSILGLSWCQHAGWKVVLYEPGRGRRLQVTLSPEDAVVVGQELARQPSPRAGLYSLVGALLRQQPHRASVKLALAENSRARTAVVVHADDGEQAYLTSAADGVALAVRARLPICAEEALLDRFGIEDEAEDAQPPGDASSATPIPEAFRRALDGPSGGA
ncbi:MAG TPA: hypothetical protein VFE37_11010 [Chloroflexota bacterium]|nr:hypothetical protein [Chloroflexota bacterium]